MRLGFWKFVCLMRMPTSSYIIFNNPLLIVTHRICMPNNIWPTVLKFGKIRLRYFIRHNLQERIRMRIIFI